MPILRPLLPAALAATAVTAAAAFAAGGPPVPAKPLKSVAVGHGRLTLAGPKACVPAGGAFVAALRAEHVRVVAVAFMIDGTDPVAVPAARARHTLAAGGLEPQTLHTLQTRATVRPASGRPRRITISAVFATCPAA